MNTDDLELPRHVHKADGEYCIVKDAAELKTALASGWALTPPAPHQTTAEHAAAEHAEQAAVEARKGTEPTRLPTAAWDGAAWDAAADDELAAGDSHAADARTRPTRGTATKAKK